MGVFHFVHGQVRALFDDSGNRVDEAGPSIPVQVSKLFVFLLIYLSVLPSLTVFFVRGLKHTNKPVGLS